MSNHKKVTHAAHRTQKAEVKFQTVQITMDQERQLESERQRCGCRSISAVVRDIILPSYFASTKTATEGAQQ